ncbi:MAG TPA: hypothetical protein VLM89_14945 [Phycisphaerae bacterium]|nr:hypothetical protein [Phycisphaerae bacterium]
MTRCTKCIIPDSFPRVTFEEGVCIFCRKLQTLDKIPKPRGKDAMVKDLPARGASSYDCLVPLSGGKDSGYALHYVVKELGLKPLAASFDHGFVADMAKHNVARLCEKYGVELVVGHAGPFRRKVIVEALRLSRSAGRIQSVCACCENDLRTFAMRVARERGIPAIIWGATTFEDSPWVFLNPQVMSTSHGYGQRRFAARLEAAKRMFGRLFGGTGVVGKCGTLYHLGLHFMYCVAHNFQNRAGKFWQRLNPYMEVAWDLGNVKPFYLYDYIDYAPVTFMKTLSEEVGWEAPGDREIRFDCTLHCLDNHQFLKDTGITLDGFTLATLARYGRLSRDDALRKELAMQESLAENVRHIGDLLKVDLSGICSAKGCSGRASGTPA